MGTRASSLNVEQEGAGRFHHLRDDIYSVPFVNRYVMRIPVFPESVQMPVWLGGGDGIRWQSIR